MTEGTRQPATRYLDLYDMRRLVEAMGVPAAIEGIVRCLREDFGRWHEFEKSPRTANHSKDGVIELMPVSDTRLYSFKYVNGHPKNITQGLMTVMAFGALADVSNGWPLLLSEMTLLTALRTAAASVFAAQLLARPDSRSMAMIGCGAQSEFQIVGFHHLVGIDEVRLFDTDALAIEKVIANLDDQTGLRLIPCGTTADAVTGADIVTTCTADKRMATIVSASMIEPGMHVNAVGGDCPGKTELDRTILSRGKVFVEYAPQTRIEGDIQQMPSNFPVIELWEVLDNPAFGRDSAEQVTVFDSVGFALEDFSALRFVYDEAIARGIGADLDLIPLLPDTRNLYGLLRPSPAASGRK